MLTFVLIANLVLWGPTGERLLTVFGSKYCIKLVCSIAIQNRGKFGGVDIQVHAGIIALPGVRDEGWLDGWWELGF